MSESSSGLTRAWPYTHVDEPRSFNKFRKQVLKPSVATETMRIAVRRSRALLCWECALVRSPLEQPAARLHVHREQCVVRSGWRIVQST